MTIPSTPRKAGPLLGTGAQTAWPFSFKVFAETDVSVAIADALGIQTTLVLNSDYSVAINPDQVNSPGGTITYPISGDPLPVGSVLSVVGALAYDQPLDLPAGGNFNPTALENQLDRIVMQVQQLRETISRSLLLPVTSNAAPSLPSPEANQLLGWDAGGTTLQNVPLDSLATAISYGTYRYDTFTGNGVTTQFVLTANPAVLGNMDVAVDGITFTPGTDYNLVAGSLVFTTAPGVGVEILARYGQALPITGPVDAAAVTYQPAGVGAVVTTAETALRNLVLSSVASLRNVAKGTSPGVFLNGYYAANDGGGGEYYYDSTDTTSVDNGGTIIVGADGGRWKLVQDTPINVKQFGAKVDGSTNDYAAVAEAITWVAANGGGIVDFPAGTTKINTGLSVPSKVVLRGAGGGENWATGSGVAWGTSPTWVTRLLWGGGYIAANMVAFADGVFDAGISDMYLDGGLSLSNITTYQADFNAGTFLQPSLNGLRITSTLRTIVSRVTIQNITTGVLMDTATTHVSGFNVFEKFAVFTCNHAVRMFGIPAAAVANTSFKDCVFTGYYNRGVDFIAWCDSNHFQNIYMSTSIAPSVGIWYNSSVPGSDNGVGFNNFTNLIMDLFNPSPADNGMRSVICGYTDPGYSTITGFISGVVNSVPSLYPEIRANGRLVWSQATAQNHTVSVIPLWAGGAKTGSSSATLGAFDLGALTFWNSNHWSSLYSTLPLVANFKPASKIVRVDWITYWNPGSTTGTIRLVNDGSGAALSTNITPGSASIRQSMQDVTSFFLPLAGGATPNYVTPNDFRIALQSAGNGTTGPTIYTSFLRVITADMA